MPFDRLWDELDKREPTPIHDELARLDETGELHRPARRWTRNERLWALLILAVLAATVLLAALTPGVHR